MKLNKLPLNVIGLNRVGLNQIGSPSRRANTSDRPYIDPEVLASLVAVCICDGKSNNDPDRAVIKNLVDPDNPFVISNAAYKLNSGYGKYEEDFSLFTLSNRFEYSEISNTKVTITAVLDNSTGIYHSVTEEDSALYWNTFKIKVSGSTDDVYIRYTTAKKSIRLYNGINTVVVPNDLSWHSFTASATNVSCNITLEFVPEYEGAFVTDGKDDMITSTKTVQEMLGGSNEITVVSMIHCDQGKSLLTNYIRKDKSGKYVRNLVTAYGETGIYGYTSSNLSQYTVINNILGDKEEITTSSSGGKDVIDSPFSVEGCYIEGDIFEVGQVAWYWTFIANKVLTTDQINQVISYFNLDKHVKPDIIYDTIRQGITNENHASFNDELTDFSGNGHNMKIYNSAWNKESGINDEGAWQTDGVTDYGQYVGDLGLKDYTIAVDRAYVEAKPSQVSIMSNGVDGSTKTPFLMEHMGINKILAPHSFGKYTVLSELNINRFISYQSTYKYNGIDITKGTSTNTGSGLTIGRIGGVASQYANIALWSLLLFPYSLSEFLLERQLKRYKLGTLYPDMIEWRPIAKSNIPYKQIDYFIKRSGAYVRLNPGDYFQSTEDIIVRVTPIRDWQLDVVSSIKVNGKNEVISVNSSYAQTAPIHIDKSPQKIDITIDEYIRYEDIVQPYPAIINLKQDGKTITWGDKLKVGSDIVFAGSANLLPELYTVSETRYNGVTLYPNTIIKVEKSMVFDNARTYLKANEPSCILSPNRLRIPNSSYKILGYIPDLTGKGNHGRLNNFAYAGMSGANGYVEDFTKWSKNSSLDDVEITYDRIKVNKLTRSTVLYVTSNKFINKIKIVASGIPNGGKLTFTQYPDNAIENNKEFEIGGVTTTGSWGFSIKEGLNLDWSNLVIQQIGEHEGSICFDGTDDHIAISTLSHGGKCMLMKVNWNKDALMLYDQRSNNNSNSFAIYISNFNDEDSIAYSSRNDGKTYIDGVLNTSVKGSQLKDVTHNITITNSNSNNDNTVSPTIGSNAKYNAFYAQMALFDFMLFPEIPSEDEIKELNDVMGIENNIEVS
ncbi:hypothetical protein [Bacteroides finegoldii]|uniref:hypothetical protein n=1 Tax=Bacteroides finegoldii TaxID=338188 RepID=UPI002665DD93|nr:hypothetical protein [Bacteroides finegoldii]